MTKSEQLKALKKIIRDTKMLRAGPSLSTQYITLGAVGGFAISFILGTLYQSESIILLIGAGIGAFVGYRYSKYKTWSERIYTQLAAYDPANEMAYRNLQKMAANDVLTHDMILDWAYMEMKELVPEKTSPEDAARKKFAFRKS